MTSHHERQVWAWRGVRRLLPAFGVLLLGGSLSACGPVGSTPQLIAVRPSPLDPGALALLHGRAFTQGDEVWLGEQRLAQVTWVNASLLAVRVPEDVAAGTHQLQVRTSTGKRVATTLTIAPPPTAPAVVEVPAPDPPAPATTSPTPGLAAPPQASGPTTTDAERKRAEQERKKRDEAQKKQDERDRKQQQRRD